MQLFNTTINIVLEYAQMLSTAPRECDGDGRADTLSLYKRAHLNSPSTVWVRENEAQYSWLYQLFEALANEYTYRYEKKHSTDQLLSTALKQPPNMIGRDMSFKQPPQCMPEQYKCNDSMIAYQKFYIGEKSHFSKWTKRDTPKWFISC